MSIRYPDFDGTQACSSSDSESWFPEENSFTSENALARRICHTCLWQEPCLEYALKVRVEGIWGGTTVNERNQIRRARNILATPIAETMSLPRPSSAA